MVYKGDIKALKVAEPKQSIDYVRLSRDFLINHITTPTRICEAQFSVLVSTSDKDLQLLSAILRSITAPTNLHTRLVYDFKLDPAFRAGQVDSTLNIDTISIQAITLPDNTHT